MVGQERNFDIHFAAVGGTGGIADTCKLYRILGIPVSVIADLDVVTDLEKLRQIVNSLCDDGAAVQSLLEEVKIVAEAIRELPPTISENELSEELQKLASSEFSWVDGDDRTLRDTFSSLRNSLNGMRKLKRGGIYALPQNVAEPLERLIDKFADIGLFLVPVGELEEWLSDCSIKASKKKKWAWANEAADCIRSSEARDDDIWKFIRQIGSYLTGQFN